MGNRKVAFVEMTVPKLAASVEVNLSSRAKAIALTVSRHGAAGQTFRHFGARYVRQNSSQGTSFSSDDASFYWAMYFALDQVLYELKEVIKMGGQKKTSIIRILELIEYGSIPQNEAVHRLEALLQSEIERKDKAADMELVEACEELLWQIGTQGRLKFEDKRKENQAALMRRLERKRRRTAALRMGTRAAAAFAVILVLAVLGDGILKREWLSGNSTEDEQQYAIQGQSIDPGLVEEGVAAGDDNIADRLITTDWESVVAFLGTEPLRPDHLPEGWRVGHYHAIRFDDEQILTISYINEADPTATMKFLWDHYFSVEAANLALEQNKDGELMEIGGIRVYRSSNMEKNRFVWIEGTTVCSLTTTCDAKEIEVVVSSFWKQ